MGLLDDLTNDNSFGKAQSHYCGVCTLIVTLPKEEAKALQMRIDDASIPHTALSRVLKANGHNISDGVLGRHRNKGCSGVAKK